MGVRTISTKLAIEGEAQYKQSVASCNSELKTFKSNLSLVESEFRNNANSMDALTAKGTALGAVYDKQLEKVTALEAALYNAKQAQEGYAARISTAQENIQRYEQDLERLRQSTGDTSKEQEELTKELDKWNAELAEAQAGQAAAERGVQNWQRQLNSAKVELNSLSDKIAQNDQYLREAEESADNCATSIDKYGKEVKKAGESSEEFAQGTEKSRAGIEQLAAALAAAGVAKSVKEIADELLECADAAEKFETAIAKLSTLIDTNVYSMDGIKAQLMELSSETGVAVGSLAEAAYQARSAGVDAANVIDFVATATKTSVAGFTDSATSVNVLTTALNAYKLTGSETERVASMLVKTQDEGKTSVGELAQNMGRVIPVAAAYSVSLENLTTCYALLTKSGTNTAIATTNLTALFNELAKKGSNVSEVLKKQTGKSFDQLMANGKNLGEIMKILADSVDGDTTAFSNLWSSTTAGQAALSLLNSGAEEFNRTMGVMANSSGAVEKNFQAMADTTEFAHQRMVTAAENLRIAIGDRLNPALENLYDVGADAFTWATDFVEENPWVVSAITGLTVAFGVLAGGITAVTVGATALKAALDLLSAHPLLLVATAAAGLVTAVYHYATAAEAAQEATSNFYQSLRDAKEAYDDLMSSMGEEQASIATLADRLKTLMSAEEKSAATKDRIKKTIDELNEAVPGLSLAYDEATDSIINYDDGVKRTTEDIDAMLEREANYEKYNAKLERLNKLQDDQAKTTKRLQAAKEQLAGIEAGDEEMLARIAAAYEESGLQMGSLEDMAESLRGTISNLTAVYEDNAAQIAELEAETAAWAQQQAEAARQQAEAAAKVEEMAATMDGLIAEMTELEAAYKESYESAYQSIDAQLGLFKKLDGTAKTSIDNLISTLEGQVKYMEDYAANIQAAMEMGVDEGLLRKLSDGSEESAQILDAIVKGGADKVAELNEQFAKVEKGKEQFSNTVAQMETDFDEKMAEIVEDLNSAIEEMDLHDEAFEAGQNNIKGLLEGSSDPALRQQLIDQYESLAEDALAAYKRPVGQHSPSKEFEKAAQYDVQGLINGAEEKKAELAAAYEDLARMALEGYADGVTKNLDKVKQALAKLESAFKNFDSYYDLKSDISQLEFELWERTDGKWATDMEKYSKKLEMLSSQQEAQAAVVAEAQAAYEAVVAQYGAASEESYKFQKTLLEEKLAYQDLLDTITQVTNAKHKAFIEQEAQRFSTPLQYTDPYQASARLMTQNGMDFAAAYEDATQRMLTASATHLPSTLEEPVASGAMERQLEPFTSAVVNAIASTAQGWGSGREVVRLVTVDGKVLAEATFDDFIDYGDSNGTPILNPKR